ncbi:hypothetical protein IA539_12495 [Gordonia sp. zg691]|uniref:Uncharacterized protein n=1 Tax=Gordonia jinghuaiqii TaxID=2758710 RepID=A0A7D7M020_9ACTN|nr:hypothetical protein [Gordonia jinghuaiqii]MBD0862027.1 hypothetical protein [Gordonia jinghuaiqii]MCR5978748.1 hypothetical protein [Gordonia jinghuaiqii]QMT03054.1 hypothetical protein H1R19_08065 [Gordonia jinghuaiqii]
MHILWARLVLVAVLSVLVVVTVPVHGAGAATAAGRVTPIRASSFAADPARFEVVLDSGGVTGVDTCERHLNPVAPVAGGDHRLPLIAAGDRDARGRARVGALDQQALTAFG